MTEIYKRHTIVDGKLGWIVVDENKRVINKYPDKDELKGLQTEPYKRNSTYAKYKDNELLNFLITFHDVNGRIPVEKDFQSNPEYPCLTTYQKHFGSWNNALEHAGLGINKKNIQYTDDELLNFLITFHEENGRIPTIGNFTNNPEYPCFQTYQKHFGSWNKALKRVGMDIDTIVEQGILQNDYHKGRLWEILIRKMFKNKSTDLSGHSSFDGICPNGQTYEAKSARLRIGEYWGFGIDNKDKDDDKEAIQWYYFGAFNKDYTELLHVWRIPGEIIEGNSFRVGIHSGKFTVENMKEYDITDKFKNLYPI
jgi:hypothetical protein